jgi:hypothetical protein
MFLIAKGKSPAFIWCAELQKPLVAKFGRRLEPMEELSLG